MILKFGSKGDAVAMVQKQLIKLGYKAQNGKALAADGDFGSDTEYAVIQLQKKNRSDCRWQSGGQNSTGFGWWQYFKVFKR